MDRGNPWIALPTEPDYVLPEDEPHVRAFNRHVAGDPEVGKPDFRLNLRMFPEPFGGNPQASVVLLARNPGIGPGDVETHRKNDAYVAALRANILGDTPRMAYLRPEFEETPGGIWWRTRCITRLLEEGFEAEWLGERILMVDYHAYHARRWRAIPFTLPSQVYTFALVRGAIERGAVIVGLRGLGDWTVAVPELDGCQRLLRTRTPRASWISRGNLGGDGYEQVLQALSD